MSCVDTYFRREPFSESCYKRVRLLIGAGLITTAFVGAYCAKRFIELSKESDRHVDQPDVPLITCGVCAISSAVVISAAVCAFAYTCLRRN